MKHHEVIVMGMPLTIWEHKSSIAEFGVGDDWATLYLIESKIMNKGHATELLTKAKRFYEAQGKKFGGTVALCPAMEHIYKKLKITEYTD